jgi:hypothetical protein
MSSDVLNCALDGFRASHLGVTRVPPGLETNVGSHSALGLKSARQLKASSVDMGEIDCVHVVSRGRVSFYSLRAGD